MFNRLKKILIITLSFLLLIFLLFNNFITFYSTIFIELLKTNKTLSAVSSDFYSNPTTDVTFKDIVYKQRGDLELKLDIYSSKKYIKGGSPVIVYVFGDCWMYGDKTLPTEIMPIINILQNEGFTIISTSYELLKSEAIFYKQISDVKDTIRWIHKNKDIYNFDVENIGIIAPSSGAQLSMIAAYSKDDYFRDDDGLASFSSKVDYVIDLFGPSNLSKVNIASAPKEIVKKLNSYNMDEISKKYSPINYVREDLPDTLIIHSENDNIVPYNTSLELYYKALKDKNNFKFLSLKNATHYLENLTAKEALLLYFNIINYIFFKSFY